MNHHLHATGMHLLDKIQRQVYHLLLNEQRDGQIKQTEHQAVFPPRHQVLRMVPWQVPCSVPYRAAVIWLAGMHNRPSSLACNDGFIVVHTANKQVWVHFDHTSTAFAPISNL